MKYYSEVTKQMYDTVVDLRMAEDKVAKEEAEKLRKAREAKEQKQKIVDELDAAYKKVKDAEDAYHKLQTEAVKAGIYHAPEGDDFTALINMMFAPIKKNC